MVRRFCITGASLIALGGMMSIQAANVAPSENPPGGLSASKVPQFIVLGFDDNPVSGDDPADSSSAMRWILNYLKTKKNPTGKNNAKTFDGSDVRASFYCNSKHLIQGDSDQIDDPTLVKLVYQEAYAAGHEIGVHTHSHLHGAKFSQTEWENEIKKCTAWLTKPAASSTTLPNDSTKGAGIPANKLIGFRTPFLEYGNATFSALKALNFTYDCSIEEGYQYDCDGTNLLWPYTLDNGSPGHEILHSWAGSDTTSLKNFAITSHAGLWELPNHIMVVPPDNKCADYGVAYSIRNKCKAAMSWFDVAGGKITGFDYNLWQQANLNKADVLAILKYSLDLRYANNRCPMTIGAHSQYYRPAYIKEYELPHSLRDMQSVWEDFITYALSKSDVRIVPGNKVVEWCAAPVALDDGSVIIPDDGAPSENLLKIAGWEAYCDDLGSTVDTGSSLITNNTIKVTYTQIAQPNDSTWPWSTLSAYVDSNFAGVTAVSLTYKSSTELSVCLDQAPLSESGESYQKALPASANAFSTQKILISQFKQPSWATNTAAMDLSKVTSLSFVPTIGTAGGSATIEISEVLLFDYKGSKVAVMQRFANGATASRCLIGAIAPQAISITVPSSGTYELALYTVDGRRISTIANRAFTAGNHLVAWQGAQLASSIYLVTLRGNGMQAVRKSYRPR